jgi:hypothetical protein
MTAAEAIKEASRLVQIDHYGANQWRVRHWSLHHRAWWEGNITNRPTAMMSAHESRIQIALELLGIEDAAALANSASHNAYPKDWRQCVRDEIKADALARSMA